MLEVRATCDGAHLPSEGVMHDLREIKVPEAKLNMFRAIEDLNRIDDVKVEIREMRQCARCAVVFTESIYPEGWTLLHMHKPDAGLMIG